MSSIRWFALVSLILFWTARFSSAQDAGFPQGPPPTGLPPGGQCADCECRQGGESQTQVRELQSKVEALAAKLGGAQDPEAKARMQRNLVARQVQQIQEQTQDLKDQASEFKDKACAGPGAGGGDFDGPPGGLSDDSSDDDRGEMRPGSDSQSALLLDLPDELQAQISRAQKERLAAKSRLRRAKNRWQKKCQEQKQSQPTAGAGMNGGMAGFSFSLGGGTGMGGNSSLIQQQMMLAQMQQMQSMQMTPMTMMSGYSGMQMPGTMSSASLAGITGLSAYSMPSVYSMQNMSMPNLYSLRMNTGYTGYTGIGNYYNMPGYTSYPTLTGTGTSTGTGFVNGRVF